LEALKVYVELSPVYYAPAPYVVVPIVIPAPSIYYVRDRFCPYCGHTLDWIPTLSYWYCNRCKVYFPTTPPKKKIF
jgi:hypothetical protein